MCPESAYLPLEFEFTKYATGVKWQRKVHPVKLQWVRRSGKFGGAEAWKKQRNLASSLGNERFLLASSQKEVPQRSAAPKIISHSGWWITCKECYIENTNEQIYRRICAVLSLSLLFKHLDW